MMILKSNIFSHNNFEINFVIWVVIKIKFDLIYFQTYWIDISSSESNNIIDPVLPEKILWKSILSNFTKNFKLINIFINF